MGLFSLIRSYKRLDDLNKVNSESKLKRDGKLKSLKALNDEAENMLMAKEEHLDILRQTNKMYKQKLDEFVSWHHAGQEEYREETVSPSSSQGEYVVKMVSGLLDSYFPNLGIKRQVEGLYTQPDFKEKFDLIIDKVVSKGSDKAINAISEIMNESKDPLQDIKKMTKRGIPT